MHLSGRQVLPPIQKLVTTIHSAKQNGSQSPHAPLHPKHDLLFPAVAELEQQNTLSSLHL